MPSINTLIKMIQNGTTAEVSYSLIPEEERRNTASMEMLISFLEESSEFDTLDPIFRTLKFHFSRFNFISTYCYST